MILISLILLLFITLIFMVIKIALWQGAITLLVKKNIDTSHLVLPAFISLLCQYIIIFITSVILNYFNINAISVIYERFMRFDYSRKDLYLIIFAYFVSVVLIICIQAVILSLASKFNMKEKLNKEELDDKTNIENENIQFNENYTFSNRIYTGMFEFSIIFIFLLIFSVVGFLLGPKLFL